ncbi:MAG: chromosomal replication initiator protein DnaA [Ruminococcus sp.]|nr:chromosomal replication initiator protein DnaA [Ruminococcus sp.]
MDSFNDVFLEVLKYCHDYKTVSEPGYNRWIKILEPYKFENNTAYLLADSEFTKTTTENNYGKIIHEAFREVMGFDVEVKILVKSKEEDPDAQNVSVTPAKYSDNLTNLLTFDNFVQGESNKLAFAFAKTVANRYNNNTEQQDFNTMLFNPLLIYGDSGLGKTHLMKAIEYDVRKNNPELKIVYTTGESFINELVKAIETKETVKFHDKYRNADFLLVDDIQTIAGKERMQEEFFHTFNELYNAGKQIVLTSDIHPSKISKLQDRIQSRLSNGMQVDITPPDLETRMAIIRNKADRLDLHLSDSVTRIIAEKIKSNVRQIEGTVKKIKALTMYTNEQPTIAMAQKVIKEIMIENHPAEITVDRIIGDVADAFDVTAEDILSKNRQAKISLARKITIYVMKNVKGMTFTQIGEALNKNHSTMTIHYNEIDQLLNTNKALKDNVDDIIKNLRSN